MSTQCELQSDRSDVEALGTFLSTYGRQRSHDHSAESEETDASTSCSRSSRSSPDCPLPWPYNRTGDFLIS